ncbi:MAG: hypothetical protein Q4C84_08180 [Bacillota bacterium]|nr:hypothetical protein [Bacillota bacterium]MDU3181756.1 hypothetical protein [Lachnospiraceae bacterium]
MKVKEILTKFIELVSEQPDIANMEVNACGTRSVLRIFREGPNGHVSGLSLEDMDYMNTYIEQAKELVENLGYGTLSEKHMEYLVELCEEGVDFKDLYNFVEKYAIPGQIPRLKTARFCINPVTLKMLHPFDEHSTPAREISFVVNEGDLEACLDEVEDERTVEDFLETYTSEEANVVYGYMKEDGLVLSEQVTYSDAFEKAYADYIQRIQMLNLDLTAKEIVTKEDYYWVVYAQTRNPLYEKSNTKKETNLQETSEEFM